MRFLVSVLLLAFATADVYMHNPRGSNNRLNEQSAARNNANRLFDSQNNDRGGYNVGDIGSTAAADDASTLANSNDPSFVFSRPSMLTTTTTGQYQMVYYEESILPFEWTAQHGCGGRDSSDPQSQNCQIILQYACETDPSAPAQFRETSVNIPFLLDGTNTGTPDEPTGGGNRGAATLANLQQTITNNNNNRRGRQESEAYYYECRFRARNKFLFVADRNLSGVQPDTKPIPTDANFVNLRSIFTMQNNNGQRRGLECPEERDYYPYWRPTPWRDIAVLTDDPARFCTNGKLNTTKYPSQNDKLKYKCVRNDWNTTNVGAPPDVSVDANFVNIISAFTEDECNSSGGSWVGFSWGLPAPDCQQADWTRVNHLGNSRDGEPASYSWKLPTVASLIASGARARTPSGAPSGTQAVKCVARLRYNISTDDYDPFGVSNQNSGPFSPVRQDPKIDVGSPREGEYLQMNLNTNQDHRTFQDRSHTFWVVSRPSSIANKNIYNLNVRGKRGNIVQTYPAVEYDFVPNRLTVSAANDLVHLQWTGSNTHNNGNNGGDGQTGDAGEGTTGTDRHNILQIGASVCNQSFIQQNGKPWCGDLSVNMPLPLDKFTDNMFSRARCLDPKTGGVFANSWVDCALSIATAGFYEDRNTVANNQGATPRLGVTLNEAPASFRLGLLLDYSTTYDNADTGPGVKLPAGSTREYYYMCSRNNNFSNRSQKGTLVVVA